MSGEKRVLLTGASGFIGRHAVEPLLRHGYDVHAVSSAPARLLNTGATWHEADLLDPSASNGLVEKIRPSHCLHFAWYTAHGKFWTATENLQWVEASLRLVRDLARYGCGRVVLAGTCAEYDWHDGWCGEETTELRPATLYGASKNGLRSIVESFCAQTGLSHAWGRIFLLYGPGESPQRLIPAVIRACLKGDAPQCSHGRQIRDFLHVKDEAEAFVALLDSAVEGAVNIGSGEPVAVREIVKKIVALCGAKEADFGAIPAPANDPPKLLPKVERLKNEVGWRPRIDLEAGLLDTIDALRSGMKSENLKRD